MATTLTTCGGGDIATMISCRTYDSLHCNSKRQFSITLPNTKFAVAELSSNFYRRISPLCSPQDGVNVRTTTTAINGENIFYLSPRVFNEHHGPRRENSPRAVGDLDIYPRVQADDKLLRGSSVKVEVVIPRRFPKLDTCWKKLKRGLKAKKAGGGGGGGRGIIGKRKG